MSSRAPRRASPRIALIALDSPPLSASFFFPPQFFIFISRANGSTAGPFAELEAVSSDSIARLTERACIKFKRWGVDADEVELYLAVAVGDDEPSADAIKDALSGPRLQASWKLDRAGIVAGSWLLARVSPQPAAAPGAL